MTARTLLHERDTSECKVNTFQRQSSNYNNDLSNDVSFMDTEKENKFSDHCNSPHSSPLSKKLSIENVASMVSNHLSENSSDSHDSGYSSHHLSDGVFCFAQPSGMAPRRSRLMNSPMSSTSSDSPSKFRSNSNSSDASSGSGIMMVENDEEFMSDIFAMESECNDTLLPEGISGLLTAPLASQTKPFHERNETPRNSQREDSKRKFRRCLSLNQEPMTPQPSFEKFRQSKLDFNSPILSFGNTSPENAENIPFAANRSFKRTDPNYDSPMDIIHTKIRKSSSLMFQSPDNSVLKNTHLFKRCRSETEATIMSAVNRSSQDPSLIGDYSKAYTLPLIQGRHHDLKSINVDTMAKVIKGEYNDLIEECTIVDCRYPYEYDGGHIIHAKNIYTKDGIMKEFLNFALNISSAKKSQNRSIIVFHCEFSSERGPTLLRYLRNQDRESNKDNYPSLHHPEIYILDGGYKAFYEKYKELCEPQTYLPMHSKDHEHLLRTFKAKAKTWCGDGKGLNTVQRYKH